MKRQLTIFFDSENQPTIRIGTDDDMGDFWNDIFILIEAIGCLAALDRKSGHTEHNGEPVNKYLHKTLDKVLADYNGAYEERRLNG
mgnify:FL=1